MTKRERAAGRSNIRSALIGGLVAAVVVTAAPVVADVAAALQLGENNLATRRTTLRAASDSATLRVINTDTGGTALNLRVEPGNPPLRVGSRTRVKNLNADLLDGKTSAAFMRRRTYDPDGDGSVNSVEGISASNLLPGGRAPAGTTIKGVFALGGSGPRDTGYLADGISFGYTLGSSPTAHYVPGGASVAQCPGSSANPQAAPGHLCVYESLRTAGIAAGGVGIANGAGEAGRASPFGFFVFVEPGNIEGEAPLVYGSWAVTAPSVGAGDLAPGSSEVVGR